MMGRVTCSNLLPQKGSLCFPCDGCQSLTVIWQELYTTWDVSGDDSGISMWCDVVQNENEVHTHGSTVFIHTMHGYIGFFFYFQFLPTILLDILPDRIKQG